MSADPTIGYLRMERDRLTAENAGLRRENVRLGDVCNELELKIQALGNENAELRTRIAREEDTELDATDFASPAWWRGQDYGGSSVANRVHEWLTMPTENIMGGVCGSPLQEVRQRIAELRHQLEEARATNTSFHRRVQQLEGRAKRKENGAREYGRFWRERAKQSACQYEQLRIKYHASDKAISELRQRAEKAEAQAAALRSALEDIANLNRHYHHSEYCETAWETVDEARYMEMPESVIEADLRKNCCCPVRQVYLSEKALTDTDAGARVQAVLQAARGYVQRYKDVPATESLSLWGKLRQAVDALDGKGAEHE